MHILVAVFIAVDDQIEGVARLCHQCDELLAGFIFFLTDIVHQRHISFRSQSCTGFRLILG